jgi:hypothetical protein
MSEDVISRLRNCEKTAPDELVMVYPGDVLEALAAAEADAAGLLDMLNDSHQEIAKLASDAAKWHEDAERLAEALGRAQRLLSVCSFDAPEDLADLAWIDTALAAHDTATERSEGDE